MCWGPGMGFIALRCAAWWAGQRKFRSLRIEEVRRDKLVKATGRARLSPWLSFVTLFGVVRYCGCRRRAGCDVSQLQSPALPPHSSGCCCDLARILDSSSQTGSPYHILVCQNLPFRPGTVRTADLPAHSFPLIRTKAPPADKHFYETN